ncbi:MAG: CRISPR-associated helicase Cas3' [Nitrospirota bacterium]
MPYSHPISDRPFLAHVRRTDDGLWKVHHLHDHLLGVSQLAKGFASDFGYGDMARLAGLWHDLGKYSSAFQAYIARDSGYDPEAHIEGGGGRVNHSSAGALYAKDKLGDKGLLLSYLIAGHHAGLPDWYGDSNAAASLSHRMEDRKYLDELPMQHVPREILDPRSTPNAKPPAGSSGLALWLRMLFSCLVDADFLDTEVFMDGEKAGSRGGYSTVVELLARFDAHMTRLTSTADDTPVNRIRAEVLRQCRERASETPGTFSLTVPTGGGKTLSSLAFALTHAVRYGKQRVIYAIPYTSIIEQTAGIFRDIFDDNVVEHHSNLDSERETAKSRLAAENWEVPIIVTTNVQFFESLFAAKTSRCRKLHNIVNSVVVLDEAHLLASEFLQPILDTINLLSEYYGVTFVLSTATQPALGSMKTFQREIRGLDNVREIIADPDVLYHDLARVSVEVPQDFHARRNWEDVAAELHSHDSVLAIVNTRRDCRDLHLLMPVGTIHLSAAMCGEHRSRVITDIRTRLKSGVPTRVISTQLVEAGVDVDFPVVYRALSGLDSIAQAAGRCNREGRLERGKVVVFVPPKQSPPGLLRQGEQTTVSLLTGTEADPMARELYPLYFQHFYSRVKSLDEHDIVGLLTDDARELKVQFRTAAELFHLIDDKDSQSVLVRYGESPALIGKLEKDGPERWLMRKLQRYSVNLPRRTVEQLLGTGEVREVRPGIFAQAVDTLYDGAVGVVLSGMPAAEQLVI